MFDFHQNTNRDLILKITVWILTPIIGLYSLYIQIHGEVSPGGGFQAGVIFAVGYILFGLIFDVQKAENLFSSNTLIKIAAIGILIYFSTGFITTFLGGSFLEYDIFSFTSDPQQLGLFIVEWGIGIAVFSCMSLIILTFYSLLSKISQDNKHE